MKKGFTLIELLVVVLIIGILAAIALPQYTKAVEKSRVAEAQLVMKSISDAAGRYYLQHSTYDGLTWDDLDISINNATGTGTIYTKTASFKYGFDSGGDDFWYAAERIDSAGNPISGNGKGLSLVYRDSEGKPFEKFCYSGDGSGTSSKLCKSLGF